MKALLSALVLLVMPALFATTAQALEIVNDVRVCSTPGGASRTINVVFLDGVFTGIRSEEGSRTLLVRYNEDETGMQLVNAMEYNMEPQESVSAYSQVAIVSPVEAVKMRQHENFNYSVGPTVEIGQTPYTCVK